jgi:hypothetical protein
MCLKTKIHVELNPRIDAKRSSRRKNFSMKFCSESTRKTAQENL